MPTRASRDRTQLRSPRREGMQIHSTIASPAPAARATGALVDREERRGAGGSDHSPVVEPPDQPTDGS